MISIIIPTYNEEDVIDILIVYLNNEIDKPLIAEIIIADGGSTDTTKQKAALAGASVHACNSKGRSPQMNEGAAIARAPIVYFLHADTMPPQGFTLKIMEAVKAGCYSGCFRLTFNYSHWFLKANSWFTRFNVNAFRFGDQSLFVKQEIFKSAGGFDERLIVFEDQEMVSRLSKLGSFKVINKTVVTDARKYISNGIFKTQAVYFMLYCMYRLGYSQQRLLNTYRWLIKQDKL